MGQTYFVGGRYVDAKTARKMRGLDKDENPVEETTEGAGEGTKDNPYDLTKLGRDKLNEIAIDAGVQEPEKLKNKGEVIKAIKAATADAEEDKPVEETTEGAGTEEGSEGEGEE